MKKESANRLLQPEKRKGMSKWEARLVLFGISAAMASMATINSEVIMARQDAVDVLDEGYEEKPPRPPRRPNAPARFALGNT